MKIDVEHWNELTHAEQSQGERISRKHFPEDTIQHAAYRAWIKIGFVDACRFHRKEKDEILSASAECNQALVEDVEGLIKDVEHWKAEAAKYKNAWETEKRESARARQPWGLDEG